MARADLLIQLVKSSFNGDKQTLKKIVESIITEERAKQHIVLADKLEKVWRSQITDKPQANLFTTNSNDLSASNLFHEKSPEKRLSDLILPEDIILICKNLIDEHFRKDLLRSYGLEPRNRILLMGSPGNGKTSLAEAIAEELMLPLIVVRYESVVGSFLGETSSRIRKIFDYVSTRACVLFFDEFETLGKERGDSHETGEIKRVVSSLLLQIDNLPSHVIIIGATNHPELLDRAVGRRFQLKLNLSSPSKNDIIKWFRLFEKKIGIELGYPIEKLAEELCGYNFSEIEEFGLSIYRKYVLQIPSGKMKLIIEEHLKIWHTINISTLSENKG